MPTIENDLVPSSPSSSAINHKDGDDNNNDEEEEEEEEDGNKRNDLECYESNDTSAIDQRCFESHNSSLMEETLENVTNLLLERSSYRNHNRRVRNRNHHRKSNRSENDKDLDPKRLIDSETTTTPFLSTDQDYRKHIARLQMDSLIPLKEDVADWLNRILNIEKDQLNEENFIDRLDNGVLVCKLIRIIEDHITSKSINDDGDGEGEGDGDGVIDEINTDDLLTRSRNQIEQPSVSIATNTTLPDSVQSSFKRSQQKILKKTKEENSSSHHISVQKAKNIFQAKSNDLNRNVRRSSLPSQVDTIRFSSNHSNNLSQFKCWSNAKSHTFFARDNVSNFLDWCRLFGVKEAVLFETEDLVSHVNQRNVVLCILEVARIACKKHSFQPAPGLVELEQEIDKEIEEELRKQNEQREKLDSFQEKFNRKKIEKFKPEVPKKPILLRNESIRRELWPSETIINDCIDSERNEFKLVNEINTMLPLMNLVDEDSNKLFNKNVCEDEDEDNNLISNGPASSVESNKDGGFHEIESGSYTSSNNDSDHFVRSPSSNSVLSSTTSSSTTSATYFGESSASTCSLTPTPMTSELDHKVMQIAKTYYGKEARQGVQRLSEGKYKIANRIVFVRLLKARHVMVRVGGGWTTLSHFLARHGGDPNQQILPDELLPLDAKSSRMDRGTNQNGHHHFNAFHKKNGFSQQTSTTHTLVISTKTTSGLKQSNSPITPLQTNSKLIIKKMIPESLPSNRQGKFPMESRISNSNSNSRINSTPASRRSSISSENSEPILSSSPTPSSRTRIPILSRRNVFPTSYRFSGQCDRKALNQSKSFLRSTSNIIGLIESNQSQTNLQSQSPYSNGRNSKCITMIPRSNTEVNSIRRYVNYLRSSQHITNKISSSGHDSSINKDEID
ncbi:hypothetical protein NH340_JMT01243 [Sarcoptes scabiei]|nr:hypothetical protein NH340_JMT01243 [Sarcoptes scabiei]